MKQFLLCFICFWITIPDSSAFNLRKVSSGIRGSIIGSVFQDNRGLIWISTNAGVSTYNGRNAAVWNDLKGVSLINGTANGEIWMESLYGLQILDKEQHTTTFGMFSNIAASASDSKGTIFIIQGNGSIYYKTGTQTRFDNVIIPDLISANIKAFFSYRDTLQVITDNGTLRRFEIQYHNDLVYLYEKPGMTMPPVLFCFRHDHLVYTVDHHYKLNVINLPENRHFYISDLKQLLSDKGRITAGIIFRNEFYFGTETGLFVIRDNKALKIPVKKGITGLLKDRYQDMIWISTAGDGIYTYSYDRYSIKSNLFADFLPPVSKPVTAICRDINGALWLGTGGDGIIILPGYDPDGEITGVQVLTERNGLPDHTVYSLLESEDGIWIGCRSGLAFYSYQDKTIRKTDTHCVQKRYQDVTSFGLMRITDRLNHSIT